MEYGVTLIPAMREKKFRTFPLPQGGLEILISLTVTKCKTEVSIYDNVNEYIPKFYMEPENFPTEVKAENSEDEDPW